MVRTPPSASARGQDGHQGTSCSGSWAPTDTARTTSGPCDAAILLEPPDPRLHCDCRALRCLEAHRAPALGGGPTHVRVVASRARRHAHACPIQGLHAFSSRAGRSSALGGQHARQHEHRAHLHQAAQGQRGHVDVREHRGCRATSRVGDRRGGVQAVPWLCPPFPASCPCRVGHHSVSGPRHIEPDRRISRIRLTARVSSIGVMRPSRPAPLSRDRGNGRGSHRRDPRCRTRSRYSTASSRIPCACIFLTANRLTLRSTSYSHDVELPTRVADAEVVHPSADDRVHAARRPPAWEVPAAAQRVPDLPQDCE